MRASGGFCPACGAELQRSWRSLVLAGLTLALVAAGYWVLTQVVTIGRIRQQVERLPTVSLVALLPRATPTFTPAPTQTVEVRPTPTHIPTATPFLSPTPTRTATATATLTPTATRRPPTATPTYPYSAPQLLSPANGTELAGADTEIVLSWAPAAGLADGDGYTVTLRYDANGQTQSLVQWVREATWVVPADLHDKLDPANPTAEWSVRITSGAADGQPQSAPSAARTFSWR